jgi:hypothetical protein
VQVKLDTDMQNIETRFPSFSLTQMNSQWLKDFNVRLEIMKITEKHLEETFQLLKAAIV